MIGVNHTPIYYSHEVNGCYFNIHNPKIDTNAENAKEAFLLEVAYQEYNKM